MAHYPPNRCGVEHTLPSSDDESEDLYQNNGNEAEVMEFVSRNLGPGNTSYCNGPQKCLRLGSVVDKLKAANEELQLLEKKSVPDKVKQKQLEEELEKEKGRVKKFLKEKEEQEIRLAIVEGEKQGLRQELEGYRKTISNLKSEVGDKVGSIKEKDQAIAEKDKANKKLIKDLEESRRRIGKLEEQNRHLITGRDENEKRLTELRGQNENMDRTNTELGNSMAELRTENERLKAADAETLQRTAELVEKIKKLEGERDEQELLTVKVEKAAEGIMEKLSRLKQSKNSEPIASTSVAVGIQKRNSLPETCRGSLVQNLPVAKLSFVTMAKQNVSTSMPTSTRTNLKLPVKNMSTVVASTTPMEKLIRLKQSKNSKPTASTSAAVRNRIQPEAGTSSLVQNMPMQNGSCAAMVQRNVSTLTLTNLASHFQASNISLVVPPACHFTTPCFPFTTPVFSLTNTRFFPLPNTVFPSTSASSCGQPGNLLVKQEMDFDPVSGPVKTLEYARTRSPQKDSTGTVSSSLPLHNTLSDAVPSTTATFTTSRAGRQLKPTVRFQSDYKETNQPTAQYSCRQCRTKFSSATSLRAHIRKEHNQEFRRKICSGCNKTFPDCSDLLSHQRTYQRRAS